MPPPDPHYSRWKNRYQIEHNNQFKASVFYDTYWVVPRKPATSHVKADVFIAHRIERSSCPEHQSGDQQRYSNIANFCFHH